MTEISWTSRRNLLAVRPKRIGVVSINRAWPNTSDVGFEQLYNGIGKNTGNLMFTESIFTLIEGDLISIGFLFDPKWVNDHLDAIVIPASNWLNDYSDWDWLIERLEDLKIPVTVIGLGLQATTCELNAVRVNASCRRLIDFFARQPSAISVRGNFTRQWLNSIGVRNVVTTGCPSIYMNIFPQSQAPTNGKIVFQGTRYGMTDNFLKSDGINRRMFSFSAELKYPMIFQSEYEEMYLLTHGQSSASLGEEKYRLLLSLYGCASVAELDAFLKDNGRVFYNLLDWSSFLSEQSAVLGTRLHGSILALNSGRMSAFVPHDSRTAEVASFAGIQSLFGPMVRDCNSLDDIRSLISRDNLQRFRDTRADNQETFIAFLLDAGLSPNKEAMF